MLSFVILNVGFLYVAEHAFYLLLDLNKMKIGFKYSNEMQPKILFLFLIFFLGVVL